MTKPQYKTISSMRGLDALDAEVTKHLGDGWHLYGNPCTMVWLGEVVCCQAMVRHLFVPGKPSLK